MHVNYAIVFVSDMARSVAFYRDILELPLRFESPEWTEFETTGATLALHVSDAPTALPDDPNQTPAGRCRFGLSVTDLAAFHERMTREFVKCVQDPMDLHGEHIAQYVDPDGLVFSVSE